MLLAPLGWGIAVDQYISALHLVQALLGPDLHLLTHGVALEFNMMEPPTLGGSTLWGTAGNSSVYWEMSPFGEASTVETPCPSCDNLVFLHVLGMVYLVPGDTVQCTMYRESVRSFLLVTRALKMEPGRRQTGLESM